MKRTLATVAVAALMGVGLAAAPASAQEEPQDGDQKCVPMDGYSEIWSYIVTTEVVEEAVEEERETSDWLTERPEGEGWEVVDTRIVEVPAEYQTEYLAGFYEQTGWVTESPGEDWVQIA